MDFTSESSSDESVRVNSGKKPYFCVYNNCDASFSRPSKLKFHIKRHTGERPFVCDEPNCNKSYLYPFHLRRHKKIHHTENAVVERVPCTYPGCYLELANKYSLKKHINRKHNSDRKFPFNCNVCKQGFHRKRQLLQHSYLHSGIYPFKCEFCDTGFLRIRNLNRHKRTHTLYKCICEEVFERWSILLAHKKNCEVVRPKCNICKKVFKNYVNLKAHLELHLHNKKELYLCGHEDCKHGYAYKRNLIYHINKVHKNVTLSRYSCTEPNCLQTFTQRQRLRQHVLKIHSKDKMQVKKVKKLRKDKGVKKTNYAMLLSFLPNVLKRSTIENLSSSSKADQSTSKIVRNSSCANELRSSDTDDSETHRNFTKILC